MHTRLFSSPRTGLTEHRAIVALMAQDLNDMRREDRQTTFEALVEHRPLLPTGRLQRPREILLAADSVIKASIAFPERAELALTEKDAA